MNKLVDIENNFITREISNVLKTYNSNKIKIRLLDGSYHTQSIGSEVLILTVYCNMSELGKALIDEAYIIDKPLKIYWYDKFYIGLIEDEPKWEVFVKGNNNKRMYFAEFNIVVDEEGSA